MRNSIATRVNESKRGTPGKVDVFFEQKGPEIKMKVTDNGCGMTPSQQHKVFNAFYSTKEEGMGVGLAFCKEAVEAAGGEIFCVSVFGQGTSFVVLLPTKDREFETVEQKIADLKEEQERQKRHKWNVELAQGLMRDFPEESEENISQRTGFSIKELRSLKQAHTLRIAKKRAEDFLKSGKSIQDIAQKTKLSEREVKKIQKTLPKKR